MSDPAHGTERPYEIPMGDLTMRGVWHHAGPGSKRGLVILHGFAGHSLGPHRLFVGFARLAATRGWDVLRFDFRGRGRSDGATLEARMDTMIEDATAAYRCFRQDLGLERLSVLGICSGAMLSLAVARRENVDQLVLWSPESFLAAEEPLSGRLWQVWRWAGHYAQKVMRPVTWRRWIAGHVDPRAVWRVVTAPMRSGTRRARVPEDFAEEWQTSGIEELRQLDRGDRRLPPIFLAFARDDPAAASASRFYLGELQGRKRRCGTIWIDGANHNFYSLEAREKLFSCTLSFLHADRGDMAG